MRKMYIETVEHYASINTEFLIKEEEYVDNSFEALKMAKMINVNYQSGNVTNVRKYMEMCGKVDVNDAYKLKYGVTSLHRNVNASEWIGKSWHFLHISCVQKWMIFSLTSDMESV